MDVYVCAFECLCMCIYARVCVCICTAYKNVCLYVCTQSLHVYMLCTICVILCVYSRYMHLYKDMQASHKLSARRGGGGGRRRKEEGGGSGEEEEGGGGIGVLHGVQEEAGGGRREQDIRKGNAKARYASARPFSYILKVSEKDAQAGLGGGERKINSQVGEGTVFLVTARVRIMAWWTWEGPRKGRIRKANVFFL